MRGRRPSRWNDDLRTAGNDGLVDPDPVVRRIGRETRDAFLHSIDQIETGLRVVGIPVGQHLRDDHTRSIDAEVQLLPPAFSLSSMLRGSPLAFADDREPRAIDDEVDVLVRGGKARS